MGVYGEQYMFTPNNPVHSWQPKIPHINYFRAMDTTRWIQYCAAMQTSGFTYALRTAMQGHHGALEALSAEEQELNEAVAGIGCTHRL